MTVNVLYVDDETDIRTIVEFALEDEEGMAIQLCASGQEALTKVESYKPDIILLDVMMPGMDGPTTLQNLRKNPQFVNTPVVFVTAKVQPHEVAQFKALGAVAVIAKPFDPMGLADQVWSIWKECQHG
jgi:CheY-like chemotaxis protein